MRQKPNIAWPVDLRLLGLLAGLWAIYLGVSVFVEIPFGAGAAPAHALIGGLLFYGQSARIVMLVQAGIFWAIAVGLITGCRWGLVLALFYMAESVASNLAFIVAYLDTGVELHDVHMAAIEGPFLVLLTLYLWIRACDLIFFGAPSEKRP